MDVPSSPTFVGFGGLIGREDERAALRASLEAAIEGRGGLILVSGEAGMGKTRLAEAAEESALELGARVLWGSCWEGPGSLSFWPWLQIARSCVRALGPEGLTAEMGAEAVEVARLVPESIRSPTAVPKDPDDPWADPEQTRLRFFQGVAGLLEAMIERQPLLVVVEDLHWADESSLLLLRFLAHELKGQRALLLGTYRFPDLGPASSLATVLGGLVRVGSVLTLAGLSRQEVGRLIADDLGDEPDDGLVSIVHERTGGNPFFVKETTRLLRARGRFEMAQSDPRLALTIPPSVRELILGRVGGLTEACRDLLAQASIAGGGFRVEILEGVTGKPDSDISDLLDEAARAGIVSRIRGSTGRYEFAHALVREAIYEQIPASRRATLHGLYGKTIEQLFEDDLDPWLGELAHHFFMASGGRRSKTASDYQALAGHRALETFAYEPAGDHFERALDSLPRGEGEERRIDLLLALGDARMRAGDWTGAREAYDDVASAAARRGSAADLARAALGLGAGLGGFEVRMFDRRQIDLLSQALDGLGNDDSELRARLLARLSVALSFVEAQERRLEMAEQAIEVARRTDARDALAYALAAHCDAIAGPAHAEQRLVEAVEIVRLARRAGAQDVELLGLRLGFVASLESGDVARAQATAREFSTVADGLRQPLYLWYVPLWKGLFALMAGRITECEHSLHEAEAIGARADSRNAELLVGSQRLNWLLESGRSDEARTLIEEYDPASSPSSWGWRAGVLAAAGRPTEAGALLDRLAANDFVDIPEDAEWLGSMCMAAEASGILRHVQAGERIYSKLLPHGGRFVVDGIGSACLGSVLRYLGVLAHVRGRLDEAAGHFDSALADNRRAGATLPVAHTLRQYGAMLLERDLPEDRERAEALLKEAIAIYDGSSLDHRAQSVRELLADVATDTRAPGKNAFRSDGEVWSLAYGGKSARVKDSKGLQDIARLLSHPGREFHVLDLVGVARTERTSGSDEVVHEQTDAGELIDLQARDAYLRRLTELEQEIEEAEAYSDELRAERGRAERDALTAQLAAAYGLGGRPRRAGDPAERARSAVTWRIRAALARIERVHPVLGAHLRRSITTGRFCSYSPEMPVAWDL